MVFKLHIMHYPFRTGGLNMYKDLYWDPCYNLIRFGKFIRNFYGWNCYCHRNSCYWGY